MFELAGLSSCPDSCRRGALVGHPGPNHPCHSSCRTSPTTKGRSGFMFETILVPVDGSEWSWQALAQAIF